MEAFDPIDIYELYDVMDWWGTEDSRSPLAPMAGKSSKYESSDSLQNIYTADPGQTDIKAGRRRAFCQPST